MFAAFVDYASLALRTLRDTYSSYITVKNLFHVLFVLPSSHTKRTMRNIRTYMRVMMRVGRLECLYFYSGTK